MMSKNGETARPIEEHARKSSSLYFPDRLSHIGVIFMATSVLAFAALLASTAYILVKGGWTQPAPTESPNWIGLVNHFSAALVVPVLCFVTGVVTWTIGYSLLRTAGHATTPVIPAQDKQVLTELLMKDPDGIGAYIRLNSLTGMAGIFTKLELSGLPLATIALTILFTLVGIANPAFFDLAKLTLGAFIGSFVQKQAAERRH